MKNTKGLSAVVTTLIIILLVLVAIGIVWVVVKGVIDTTADQIDINKKCIGVALEVDGELSCSANTACTIIIKKLGGTNPDGIKVFLYDADGVINSGGNDTDGDVSILNTVTITPATDPTRVEAVAYFEVDGEPIFCTQTASMEGI